MESHRLYNEHPVKQYHTRILKCIVVVELLMIALVFFWPVSSSQREKIFQVELEEGVTTIIEAPIVTHQSAVPPPPPSPQVPVEVPNDVVIKEHSIDFLEFSGEGKENSTSLNPGNNSGKAAGKVYKNPELAPSVNYIVEPTIENRTEHKALIYVRFLVDRKGNVEEAIIAKILLFNDAGKPTIKVNDISERVLSAILQAALQWKFSPAKKDGHPVRAYTKSTFTIDY